MAFPDKEQVREGMRRVAEDGWRWEHCSVYAAEGMRWERELVPEGAAWVGCWKVWGSEGEEVVGVVVGRQSRV